MCLVAVPLWAASPANIEIAVQKGVAWLATQQKPDGSWTVDGYPVGETGLVLSKLVERAHELGQDPFDPDSYSYASNVNAGYSYLFSKAHQYGGRCLYIPNNGYYGDSYCYDPSWYPSQFYWADAAPAGSLVIDSGNDHMGYENGVSTMAIAATKTPNKVVSSGNAAVNGLTYKQVVEKLVAHTVWSQEANGGWHYYAHLGASDNSPTGYTVLGLRYAEAPSFGFNVTVPASTKTKLKVWVDYIQNDTTGASGYTQPGQYDNALKTGNLLFQSEFADPGSAWAAGVQSRAIGYLQDNWISAGGAWYGGWKRSDGLAWYQATYNIMKGFQTLNVDTITVGVNTIDWFNGTGQFADTILAAQNANGSWTSDVWGGNVLSTVWALLTLEKIAPPPPINVSIQLAQEICDTESYTVTVNYASEVANVDGTVVIKRDGVEVTTINLSDFIGTGSWTSSSVAAGDHSWTADLDVVPTGGAGTPAHASKQASIDAIDSPVLGDIPDQSTPFSPFDLDDFNSGGSPATWAFTGGNVCLQVSMDGGNVVTVTNPGDACQDAETVAFTATTAGSLVSCSASDSATFVPNQPPVAVCADVEATANASCEADGNIDGGSYDPDGDALTQVQNPAGPFGLGLTAATLTVSDPSGESDTCSANVNVTDSTNPTIQPPADITVNNDTGDCGAIVVLVAPLTGDNCSVATVTRDYTGDFFPVGTTVVTWTVTDGSGNQSFVTQNVTVVDAEAPVLAVPANALAQECPVDTSTATMGVATATDNCAVASVVNSDVSVAACGNTETITRTWTATDSAGNVTTATQTIEVVDTTPPTLTSNVSNIHPSDVPVTYTVSTADTCSAVDLNLTYDCNAVNGSGKVISKLGSCVVSIGGNQATVLDSGGVGNVITLSATATDQCGNSASKAFNVKAERPFNQGVGNGPEGGDPGNSNQGNPSNSNDENGGVPGNPGKKGGKK